jgi:hypothetical protein
MYKKSQYSQRNKNIFRQIRLIPTPIMVSSLDTIIYEKYNNNKTYNQLSTIDICDILNDILINFTFNDYSMDELLNYFKIFYSLICHDNMPSFMEFRNYPKNSVVHYTERLLTMTYLNPIMINILCSSFIKELFIIGVNHICKEHIDIFLNILCEGLLKIKNTCDKIINECSTLSTKYDPTFEKMMLNINGGHGQGHIVPSILSDYDFFTLIYGNEIKTIMGDLYNPSIFNFDFDFDSTIISTEYTDSIISEQSIFVAKLFLVAPFGFVRKLLEILFGYKAFEFFDTKKDSLRGIPFDRSNKMNPYTMGSLIDRIKTKMIEILMNPEKQITNQLWTKCYNISFFIYKDIIDKK